jgi:hypothetical protein
VKGFIKWETTRINDYLLPNDGTWSQRKRNNVYIDKKMKLKGTVSLLPYPHSL